MPLIVLLIAFTPFLLIQFEFAFFFGFFCYNDILDTCYELLFCFLNNYNLASYSFIIDSDRGFHSLNYMKLDYNYNYRTFFSQTYLHAAYNKHMKPYKNLVNMDRLFGDYNVRTYGKSKKHARAIKHTRLFFLLYSHTMDCYALNTKLVSFPSVLFYFKRQHLYSVLEMFYASVYLGMIYFFVFTYTRMIEDGSLNNRETEEIDEEEAQNHWYYFREDRRGLIEPAIEDNEEVNFAYPQHPVEWDDNGHFYRWEMHFFIFLFSFLICWGVSQSAASMFFYDNFIDLHFVNWGVTFVFIFIFWRIFFLLQFFTFFNRFNVRRFLYLQILLPIFSFVSSFIFRCVYNYLWPFAYTIFSRFVKLLRLETENFSGVESLLISSSVKSFWKNIVIRFYRYIYSSFQKDLNLFEKRNIYDFLLTSNLSFLYNSRLNIDGVFYLFFKKDKFFARIRAITDSFIDNYRLHRGFFFPKNMYLTTNKILFPFMLFTPPPFPFYLDYVNVNDLPMWGSEFFFSQIQAVFPFSESCESWFFAKQYNSHFDGGLPLKKVINKNYLSS